MQSTNWLSMTWERREKECRGRRGLQKETGREVKWQDGKENVLEEYLGSFPLSFLIDLKGKRENDVWEGKRQREMGIKK